ncbi:MAG: CHRD domain-containing protein [Chloroflexota bacterium]
MREIKNIWQNTKLALFPILLLLVLIGCAQAQTDQAEPDSAADHSGHAMASAETHTPEIMMDSPIPLNPSVGTEIGAVYEAYLSPEQEGDDEENTPDSAPDVFKSTAPSIPREQRTSHGHGVLSFTNDLSKAFVHIEIENVNPEDIVMFHLHCGRPGQLGPIIVDFGLKGDPATYFEDGVFTMEILNEDLVATTAHGEGVLGAFTAGCPITTAVPLDKVKTIAGMQLIAEQGEIYFNLHTAGQTFFGDIRGQLQRVEISTNN